MKENENAWHGVWWKLVFFVELSWTGEMPGVCVVCVVEVWLSVWWYGGDVCLYDGVNVEMPC